MEYSLFMIKPCAYAHKDEILSIINGHVNILYTRDVVLNEKFLNKLYEAESDIEFKNINTSQLKDKRVCIGIVSGKNAIQDLIRICGDDPKGTKCDEHSIRYRFNPSEDVIYFGNRAFFVNAIHKSDSDEAIDNVTLFITEFLRDEVAKCNLPLEERLLDE